jgi:hypothetical protein
MLPFMAYHRQLSAVRRDNAVEQMRRALPLPTYLKLMHEAAVSGMVPVLDRFNNATGEFTQLKPQERMEALKFLVNKAMPDVKTTESLPPPSSDEALDATTLSELTTEQLVQAIRDNTPAREPVDAVFSA